MRAAAGDRVLVARPVLGQPVRDGEILEVHGAGGEPPYLVRWADSGRESLFVPGPDCRVEHFGPPLPPAAATGRSTTAEATNEGGEPRRVQSWHVDVYLSDGPDGASAHAVLHTAAPVTVEGHGRSDGQEAVAEIADEVAAASALRQLADHLLAVALTDRAALGHRSDRGA